MGHVWRQLSGATKRRLGWATAGSLVLPRLAAEFAKTFYQPGLHDDAERAARLVDILSIGVSTFSLAMVFTVLMGCLLTASMKGPACYGDPFPSDQ